MLSIQGNSLDVTSQVDSWAGKGVDQRTFGPVATPLPTRSPSRIPVEERSAMQLHPSSRTERQQPTKNGKNK